MTEIFLYIINMSITASILAVVVLLLRLVLKKAPKWISVLLWGLVALRLICPFAVESSFSLMPKTDWIEQETLSEEDLFLDSVPDSIPVVDSSSFGKDVAVEYSYYPIENPEIEIHRGVSTAFILSCVWIAGMSALFLHAIISTIRLRRSIGAAIRVRDNVWESSAVDSPFVLGLFSPRIYVPRGMTEEKLTYVVAHEQAHIRRKDHWWKPLGFLLLTVHWFNPVMWLSYILLCRDIEIACDEKVVCDMGEVERADYSEALLECSVKRSMISACPLAFGEVGVKERIKTVLNYKKPAFWIVVLAVIACAVAAVCFLTNPMDKTEISIDEHDWYFERSYSKKHEKDITIEAYQPGLQPKTKNAEPVNAILVPDGEPMWYQFVTGDWDTDRIGLHFIPEKADSKSAHYTVELYRDTGERYTGVTSTAVIEPMKNGDGYILTIYENSVGSEEEIIFTTKKQPGAVNGKKKLTLEEVITLSEKNMALTWEDFAEYSYTDVGTWDFSCIYEIDDVFWLEITGGSMHGTPMQILLCTEAEYGDGAEFVYIRRTYADEDIVKNFIKEHGHHTILSLDGIPDPVNGYQNDIIEQAAEAIFGAVTVYASGIENLEKIPTGTVGLSEEILLYRLDYWITKGINGLNGTPPEDIWRETVYFAMFHDWTSDTWTRLGTITEAEIDELYNTDEMLEQYGNKYTAAAVEMHRKHQLPAGFSAVLGFTEGQLIFDNAVVGSAVPEKICEYRYVPVSVTDDMRESLFDTYFGDRADEVSCKDEQKDIWQLGETMSGDFYKYETVLGGQVFTLRYSVPNLNPLDDNQKGYGEQSGCTITAEEAVRLCDELLASMTDAAQYRIDYIHYYGSNGQSPFYWICYKKILEGRTVNAYKDIFFFVDDNGVEEMHGAFYDTEVIAEYSEVLSAEQAVEALRKQLNAVNWKEIGISEVSKISLEYITKREASGWGTWGNDLSNLTILPIWRMELGKTEEERILNRNRIIGVHAVTGELIQNLTGMGNYN